MQYKNPSDSVTNFSVSDNLQTNSSYPTFIFSTRCWNNKSNVRTTFRLYRIDYSDVIKNKNKKAKTLV